MAHKLRKKFRYTNPKAPKPDGDIKKPFTVSGKTNITGEDTEGVVRKIMSGETIMLTENMATFYANLGYVDVEMDFGTEKDAEIDKLKAALAAVNTVSEGADAAPESDADETQSGDTVNTGGGVSGDGLSRLADAETAKSAGGSRRKTL